ncbi:hypothetical protein NDU88_000861 [Pleurodeles waltl]|uniref:Uncharacterized protein n=1 Tax=Pleurodeles waltl TaxID=8319 RepID=A0AAV7MR33_PLEWA|nr:hypothetical protein NDU88_000861 [Pleurodeles waltl]
MLLPHNLPLRLARGDPLRRGTWSGRPPGGQSNSAQHMSSQARTSRRSGACGTAAPQEEQRPGGNAGRGQQRYCRTAAGAGRVERPPHRRSSGLEGTQGGGSSGIAERPPERGVWNGRPTGGAAAWRERRAGAAAVLQNGRRSGACGTAAPQEEQRPGGNAGRGQQRYCRTAAGAGRVERPPHRRSSGLEGTQGGGSSGIAERPPERGVWNGRPTGGAAAWRERRAGASSGMVVVRAGGF